MLVTHAAPSKMILTTALNVDPAVAYRMRVDTASLSGFTVEADGAVMVWAINETGHLDGLSRLARSSTGWAGRGGPSGLDWTGEPPERPGPVRRPRRRRPGLAALLAGYAGPRRRAWCWVCRAAVCRWPRRSPPVLGADLDVLVVRKLGVPGHPELAMGAIAAVGQTSSRW